jgi:hypothetical protein
VAFGQVSGCGAALVSEGRPSEPGKPESGYRFGPGAVQPERVASVPTPESLPPGTGRWRGLNTFATLRCGSCRKTYRAPWADLVEGLVSTCPHCGQSGQVSLRGDRAAATSEGSAPPLGEYNTRVIPQSVKIAVAARDGGKCRECGSSEDLQYDHVIPWSRGGANTVNNVQLLCGECNRRKGARY